MSVDLSQERAWRARRALQLAEAKTGTTPLTQREMERSSVAPAKPGAGIQTVIHTGRGTGTRDQTISVRSLTELENLVAPLIAPGSAVTVTGSTSALFAVAVAAWGPEDWGVIAGLPNAGLLAAAQIGVPLARTVVIPDLGVQPVRVLAALVDAYSVVVLGQTSVNVGDRRRIEARMRRRRSRLITSSEWAGAAVAVHVERIARRGIGQGDGVVQGPELTMRLNARGVMGMAS
jgi:hypothetical protein